jgi:hypothetical protein
MGGKGNLWDIHSWKILNTGSKLTHAGMGEVNAPTQSSFNRVKNERVRGTR